MESNKEEDAWLENAKAPIEGEKCKATIQAIRRPRPVKTQYGERNMIEISLRSEKGDLIATEYLPKVFPVIPPSSNIGKILKLYKCKSMAELIGKEVDLQMNSIGFWKVNKE